MAWPFSAGQPWDSGIVTTVPTSSTAVPNAPTGALWMMGMHLANTTSENITVTATDGSSATIVPDVNVPANGVVIFAWNFMPLTGLKWMASAAGINGKAWGV